MSTQNKVINHNFNIGTIVYIIHECVIVPCVIVGITGHPTFNSEHSIYHLIDDTNIRYDLIKIRKTFDKDSRPIFTASSNTFDKYNYHSSKVYGSVNDLLSDLEKTIEKF